MKNLIKNIFLYLLKVLAQAELKKHKKLRVIGITGTVGKSSCKDLVAAFLKPHYGKTLKYTEKGNSETGIPYEILNIPVKNYSIFQYPILLIRGLIYLLTNKQEIEVFVIEYGIDSPYYPKNMDYLLSIVKPEISVLLSIGETHGEYFEEVIPKGTPPKKHSIEIMKAIALEKVKLLEASQKNKAFITKQALEFIPETIKDVNVLESLENIKILKWTNNSKGIYISLDVQGTKIEKNIQTFVLPESAKNNFLFALSATLLLKKDVKKSLEKLEENLPITPGRSSLLEGKKGTIIIDSSYNASPYSAIEMLKLLNEVGNNEKRHKIAVLGDLRELGAGAEKAHINTVKAACKIADTIILTNQNMKTFGISTAEENGFTLNENLFWFENGKQLSYHILDYVEDDSVVLFEGSQNTVFLEFAVKELLKNQDPEFIEKHIPRMTKDWDKLKE